MLAPLPGIQVLIPLICPSHYKLYTALLLSVPMCEEVLKMRVAMSNLKIKDN